MIATGVIVEYNPFHNGHLHHIKESRQKTGADVVIAVMSGHFLQRGEPALLNKWARAEMALKNGVDLVIELPYPFATGYSQEFARGGVALLEALNCKFISFGSEHGSIERFKATYNAFNAHSNELNKTIQESVKSGVSYPQALNNAYEHLEEKYNLQLLDLSKPNNILGYHYFEEIQQQQATIEAVTIQRIAAGYHEQIDLKKNIASATGIRKELFENKNIQAIEQFLPPASFSILQSTDRFVNWNDYYPYLRFTILRHTAEQLKQYVDITEGIENLLLQAAKQCETFEQFMQKIKSKRFTWTRLQRMLTHILVGYTKVTKETIQSPSYIRILGMTESGQKYLNEQKKNIELPLVSKVGKDFEKLLALDIRASDLYMIGSSQGSVGMDFKTPPIRIQKER